jgi:hypothetical protein
MRMRPAPTMIALRQSAPGLIKELLESEELARKPLQSQASWIMDHSDDEPISRPATAGEAHLFFQE